MGHGAIHCQMRMTQEPMRVHEHGGPILPTPCAPCSRQYGLTLDLMDPSCLRRFKALVALELLNALCLRGAAFVNLAFRCSDKLRSNSDTTSADMAMLPMLSMVIFNVLSNIDALKHAVRWLPAKPGARELGQEATIPLQATDEDNHRAARRLKSKGKVPGRASRRPPPRSPPDGSDDDELVFGGAQDGPELDDAEPADAPEPAMASRPARSQRHRFRAVGDGLIFGKSHEAAATVSAVARETPADAQQFPMDREVPQSAQRAESVVFPSKWTSDEDDGVSMVSAPITPLERQRRMAQTERDRVDADERRRLHADKVERARAQALDEAARRRERSAKRSRAAEQQQREEEEQVRDRWRRRADADAVHQAQRDTHERGERLRVEAEQAANLSRGSTEAPPMVDHDSILTSGRLPKWAPAPRAIEPPPRHSHSTRAKACLLLSAASKSIGDDACVPRPRSLQGLALRVPRRQPRCRRRGAEEGFLQAVTEVAPGQESRSCSRGRDGLQGRQVRVRRFVRSDQEAALRCEAQPED